MMIVNDLCGQTVQLTTLNLENHEHCIAIHPKTTDIRKLIIDIKGEENSYLKIDLNDFSPNIDVKIQINQDLHTFIFNANKSILSLHIEQNNVSNIQIIPPIKSIFKINKTKNINLLYLDDVVNIIHIGETHVNYLMYNQIKNIFGLTFDVDHLACTKPFIENDKEKNSYHESYIKKTTKLYNTQISSDQEGGIYGHNLIGYGTVMTMHDHMKYMNLQKANVNDLNHLVMSFI